MDLDRFEQFKRESTMVIENSIWVTQEIDKVLEEEAFYASNPYLDTYELMERRCALMNELQNRADVESRIDANHRHKYKDLYDIDF
jgi:hypothetical protein